MARTHIGISNIIVLSSLLAIGCSAKQYPVYTPPMDSHVGSLYIDTIEETSSGYLVQYQIIPEESIKPYVADKLFDVCYDVDIYAALYDEENEKTDLTVVNNHSILDFSKAGEYSLNILSGDIETCSRIELTFVYTDTEARYQYTMETSYLF